MVPGGRDPAPSGSLDPVRHPLRTTFISVSSQTKISPGEMLQLRLMAKADPAKAGPAWRALSEAQTAVCAERTGDLPYTVICAPKAPGGPPGLCAPKAARIMLEGELLPVAPDQLDPHTNPEHMTALAKLHGVLIHECGHAVHTREDRAELFDQEPDAVQAAVLLEEIRMEAQVIGNRPADARWLRAATREILLADETISGPAAAFGAAVLIEGRIAAGTLRPEDVSGIAPITEDVLGKSPKQEILRVCERATRIADDDISGLARLSRELAALMPEEMKDASGQIAEAIKDALGEAAADALGDGNGESDGNSGSGEIEDLLENLQARQEVEKSIREGDRNTAGGAGGSSPERGERHATPEEREARNKLTRRLREVRWRDRSSVRRNNLLPPGRLRSREALRRSAEQSLGKMTTARPWKTNRRRAVETPQLTCGILIDTSGSMGYAAHELSGALWAIAHAVHENGGKVAAALFGDTAETVLPVEKPPRHVIQIHPSGGTEHVPEGIELLGRELGWSREAGPRLLVMVSDGYFACSAEADEAVASLRSEGILVVHIGVGMNPVEHGADETLRIDSARDLLPVVGDTAVRELRNW